VISWIFFKLDSYFFVFDICDKLLQIIDTSDFSHKTAAKANAPAMLNFTSIEEHLNIKK